MVARLSALVIWALVALVAVFWGLRLWTRAPQAPPYAATVGENLLGRADLTKLFGAPPVEQAEAVIAPETASRFQLLGVIAPKRAQPAGHERFGVALIAVDGQPPKAYRVGATLTPDDDLVLQSVGLRTAALGPADGKAALTLELPILPPAATGTLPAAGVPAAMPTPVPGVAGQMVRRPGAMGLPPGMQQPQSRPMPVPVQMPAENADNTAPTE
jgi:general secretion pathway protein C